MEMVRLSESEYGPSDGAPFLLLHGFPLHRSMWGAQAAALARAGFRVIVPDLRGHGKSPAGEEASTMSAMAKDVLAMLDRLNVENFFLGGFSLGGYVALEIMARAPSRVGALLLVDTRAESDSELVKKGRMETEQAVRRDGMKVLVEKMVPKFLTEASRQARPELVSEIEQMILENSVDGAAKALLGMAQRVDRRELLSTISCPTLIIVGELDAITPPDAAKVLAEGIPKARLQTLAQAAHLTPMETPQLLAEAIVQWAAPLRPARTT